jgi:hypothetical protein
MLKQTTCRTSRARLRRLPWRRLTRQAPTGQALRQPMRPQDKSTASDPALSTNGYRLTAVTMDGDVSGTRSEVLVGGPSAGLLDLRKSE